MKDLYSKQFVICGGVNITLYLLCSDMWVNLMGDEVNCHNKCHTVPSWKLSRARSSVYLRV